MWTINDFLAYRMLSGWSTHEKLECSYCMENNKAFTLINGGKAFFFLLSPSFLPTLYKYHLSCTLHYHRCPYRRTHVRQYFTESWKIITGNATLTDDFADGLPSVSISQRVEKYLLEMPQSPTTLQTDYRASAFHRELKKYYWKCHNHRRCGGRIPVRRHVVGGSKLPTKSPTDCANSKQRGIKCISDRVSLSMELPTLRKIWRVIKNDGAKFKMYRWIFETSPTE